MKQLNKLADERGWRYAIDATLREDEEYLKPYVTSQSRASFIKLLPNPVREGTVLDFGCHMGGLSFELAQECKTLVAADSTFENLEFLDIRKEQEGISNVHTVCVNPLDYRELPFQDSLFDLVVINGVLEWVGTQVLEENPRVTQVKALQELRRITKAGGYIYIGIENRFSYSYVAGSSDHSGVPYTSILPRKISSLLLRLLKRTDYRTYTYSYWGYKQLLSEAGFSDVEIYHAIPSYRYPSAFIKVNARENLKNYIKNEFSYKRSVRNLWSVMLRLHIENVFGNSFGILIKR